jgi:hypothetical protein
MRYSYPENSNHASEKPRNDQIRIGFELDISAIIPIFQKNRTFSR